MSTDPANRPLPETEEPPPHSPQQRLRAAAEGLTAEPVTLAQLAAWQGSAALGSLLLLLAAPCVLPVPGVGNVMGLGPVHTADACARGAERAPG